MIDKKNSRIKNFTQNTKLKLHECGLAAAISAVDPFLRNEDAVLQTKNDIDAAILLPAIGGGLAVGIALSNKYFPAEEGTKLIETVFPSLQKNYEPRLLTTIVSTATGFGVGAKFSSSIEKFIDKAAKRNEERKQELKELNPERFAVIDKKTEKRAERHITRNARIKAGFDKFQDKISDIPFKLKEKFNRKSH